MPSTSTEKLGCILKRLESERSDEEAWRMLYAHLWPLVFATNYRILRGDRGLAADGGQEVFLRLYRYARFQEFGDRPEAFLSYVLAICRNVSRDYLSLILREPPVSDEEVEAAKDESEITWSAKADNPEIAAIRSNQLSGFLSSLETKDRELVELLLRGSTTPEIAKRLGLTYTNAAVRIHRIRQLARNSMKT